MSKKQVLYIHGGSSYSNYDDFLENLKTKSIRDLPGEPSFNIWSKHLVEDLADNFEVFTPSMPNKQNAKYIEWKIWFERYFDYLHDDIVLVGWSLGGMFLVKYLIENDVPFKINALFLVAAPLPSPDLGKEDCRDFCFDIDLTNSLQSKTDHIYLYHSQDDFVVPYNHSLQYKTLLPQAKLVSLDDYGHCLVENFVELLTEINKFY